jgi:hypothetical protein
VVFRSAVGNAFIAAAVVVLVLGGANAARALALGRPLMAIALALPIALFGWVWMTTSYTLTETDLEIRCAFVRMTIPFRSITRVQPTRTLQSAPALSIDRLEIRHDGGVAVISPKDRTGFIRELRARCPRLEDPRG